MKKSLTSRLLPLTGALLLGLGAICSPLSALAEEQEMVTNLIVDLKTGASEEFMLPEKPVLTFSSDECTITTSQVVVTYDMADVEKAYFAERPKTVGVDNTAAETVSIDLSVPETVIVRGLNAGTGVVIYDINGRTVARAQADSEGTATLSTESMTPNTVYVVSISNIKNFKLYKR